MREDEWAVLKMEEQLSGLPPSPADLKRCIPWRAAMDKVLWGTVLTTFRLNFFYLQYILPLLGSALLYLGYRSLRRENRWFRLCWILSAALLAAQAAVDILAATPVLGWIGERPALSRGLTGCLLGMNLLLLFALWRGTRSAFAAVGEQKPRDWLAGGFVCYLLVLAVALWSELVPLTEPSIFGPAIVDQYQWLFYGRGIAAFALEICLLVCISRQSDALAGGGYDIVPAPVRICAKPFLLGLFALVLLSLPPALWISGHVSAGDWEQAGVMDTRYRQLRDRLVELGLSEEVAAALDREELDRCAGATAVVQAGVSDNLRDSQVLRDGGGFAEVLDNALAEFSSWLILLPGDQVRQIHFFRYARLPELRLQEQFSVDPSGNYGACDFAGRLLWEDGGGSTFALTPEIRLGGGETAEEVEENLEYYMLPESALMEVERLGHLHYIPWFDFTVPAEASTAYGYLAYTVEGAVTQTDDPEERVYGDFWDVVLRHQSRWLHYPFQSISALGGTGTVRTQAIQSAYGHFYYYF